MEIRVYKGKLGNEKGIATIPEHEVEMLEGALPAKGDLIAFGVDGELGGGTVYKVKQVLMDYTHYEMADDEPYEPTYSLFVEEYDWEG